MSNDAEKVLGLLNIIRSARAMLNTFGVNYREVDAAVEAKEAAGGEFGADDAQVFIDQARSAADRL